MLRMFSMNMQIFAEEIEDVIVEQEMEEQTSTVVDMHMQQAKVLNYNQTYYENPRSSYKHAKSPAQITRQGDYYFIVDTFHDQVLYSNRIDAPVTEWYVMTRDVTGPHAVASDGTYYLVTDTEKNRILVFERKNGGFRNTQVFENIGERPHYITYDVETDSFFTWSSMTGDMYILKKDMTGVMCIREIRHIKELEGHYIRSFTICGDYIFFPSGTNRQILLTEKDTLKVCNRYPVPDEISGMAFILPIEDYFYMTVSSDETFDQSKATILRTNDLNHLSQNIYEDIRYMFPDIGIPYYIDSFHGAYYMTNHGKEKNVLRFSVQNNELKQIGALKY